MKFRRYLLMLLLLPVLGWTKSKGMHFDPVSPIIFWVTLIYAMSISGQYCVKLFKQPAVLGELLAGIIFGNICYHFKVPEVLILREGAHIFQVLPDLIAGQDLMRALQNHVHNVHDVLAINAILKSSSGMDYLNIAYVLDIFSRYGLIYLLFMVGLETSWTELKTSGKPAFYLAILGVLLPVVLSFFALYVFFPQYGLNTNIFVAATLSATSVGITARVLQDMGKLRSREARIILGAAMIDDVLGLFILAIVSSLVLQGHMDWWMLLQVIGNTILFFILSLSLGSKIIQKIVPCLNFLESWERKFVISFIFVMLMSWVASLLQLSTIIGAFTAGLILRDELFVDKQHKPISEAKIKDLMAPIQFLLTPLFFFLMGVQVKLETFLNPRVMFLAVVLSFLAIIGKLLGAYVLTPKLNRLFIGIGMVPRGEVGLIFASMGASLGVVSAQMFSAIVVMVVVTTVVAPIWMRRAAQIRELDD